MKDPRRAALRSRSSAGPKLDVTMDSLMSGSLAILGMTARSASARPRVSRVG
jgi:hypothetical protein